MRSIRTNLVLALLVPLTAVAAIVSLETFYSAQRIARDLGDKTLLAASLTILERVIATNGTLLADETLDTLTENLGDQFFYHVSGPNGAFVTGYSGYPRPPKGVNSAQQFYDGQHLGQIVRVLRLRRDLSDRELNGITTITTWQRTQTRQAQTISLFTRSLIRLVLLVLAAVAIVWFAVRWGLSPLITLQAAIERRTPYDLKPIKRTMPLELSGIVGSMNELFTRMGRSKAARERFIGDAAHQLKNPIAAIKLQAQTALDAKTAKETRASLEQIVAVTDSSNALVHKMLSGASAYAMDRSTHGAVDLSAVINGAVSDIAPLAFTKGQEVAVSGTENPVIFTGSEILLREAIINLLDNAVRYSSTKGHIEAALTIKEASIDISVSDEGVPLSEEEFLKLTQPFFSGDQPNAGRGVGLSITKDIAKSHGGYLRSVPTENGKAIIMTLPKAASA
ncbi:MAG: sensor histidine kinase [Pseudomonadota bacterium]